MTVTEHYADNDIAKMRAIVDAALGPSPSNLLEPIVTTVRSALQYIDRLAIPVLSDSFLEALKMEPLTLKNYWGTRFESDQLFDAEPVSCTILNEIKGQLPKWPSEGGEAAPKPCMTIMICVYDREMLDSVAGARPLKPDLILTRHKKLGPKECVRWRDVDVVIEVNSKWQNLVRQGATYARALFYSNWTRTSALVIGINHKSRGICFMFLHRGGVTSTRELTMDGEKPMFSEFVPVLRAIFSWSEPETAGSFQRPHHLIARLEAFLYSRVVLASGGVPIELQFCRERRRAVQYHWLHPRRLKMVRTYEDPHATKRLHAECGYHLPAMSKCHNRDPRRQRSLLPQARRAPLPR